MAKLVLHQLLDGWQTTTTIFASVHTTEARARISEIRRAGFPVEDEWRKNPEGGRFKAWRIVMQ